MPAMISQLKHQKLDGFVTAAVVRYTYITLNYITINVQRVPRLFLNRVLRWIINELDDTGIDSDLLPELTAGKTEWLPTAHVLWYTHINYPAHNSPTTDRILSHLHPVRVCTTCFLKIRLEIHINSQNSSYLRNRFDKNSSVLQRTCKPSYKHN